MTASTQFADLDERVSHAGLSDVFAADLFAEEYSHELKFDRTAHEWRIFDHPVWRKAKPSEVQDRLIQSARSFQKHAEALPLGSARDKCLSWSKFLLTVPGLRRVESVAQRHKAFEVDHQSWNSSPLVIAAKNDVIDLRTGSKLANSREQLLTLALPIPFDPTARCDRFLRFLNEIFDRDHPLIHYIWRLCGYILTASVEEQLWWLFFGGGANGKSVFLNILAYVLGDYALTVPMSMFHHEANIPADVAKLAGC